MGKNILWIKAQKVLNLSPEWRDPTVSFTLHETVEKEKAVKETGKKKTAEILRNFCRPIVGWLDGLESLKHKVWTLRYQYFFISLHRVVMIDTGLRLGMLREMFKHLGFMLMQGSRHLNLVRFEGDGNAKRDLFHWGTVCRMSWTLKEGKRQLRKVLKVLWAIHWVRGSETYDRERAIKAEKHFPEVWA